MRIMRIQDGKSRRLTKPTEKLQAERGARRARKEVEKESD
jgi:hypothetical protein